MTFCANARGRIISAILVVIAVTVADVCLAQDVPAVRINVHNESGAAIAGATVRIQSDRGVSIDTTTGTDGRAAIPQLAPGEYRIVIAAEDFQQLSHLVSVQTEGQEIDLEFTLVPELRRTDSVDVIAAAQDVGLQPSSLASEELRSADVALLPLRPSTVVDALPLVPGVNRSSDGEIQIGGQGEQRSALLVNTSNVTDPGTGRFTSSVPADSVESVEVLKTPFLPRYGSFTSGVVAVETKRGGEKWRGVLKEFIPSFRIRSRHIRGLRDALPRLSFGGPILKNRLFFSEAVQYRFEKRQTRTLSFPHNESKNELVNSFSQFDYIISPGRFITATVHVTPHHINFVDPQFFNAILEARRHYVGIPYNDKTRFRNYISLDERMSKDIKLLAKYTARLSVSVLNVFNHFNPLDVHANTADPLLGVFFGHFKRRYRAHFEILF